jgi:hypothetical protein
MYIQKRVGGWEESCLSSVQERFVESGLGLNFDFAGGKEKGLGLD